MIRITSDLEVHELEGDFKLLSRMKSNATVEVPKISSGDATL